MAMHLGEMEFLQTAPINHRCLGGGFCTTNIEDASIVTIYMRVKAKIERSVLMITWVDKVTNKEILERTGLSSMADLLIRKNLRWTGHLMRMSPDRLPKQVLYSQLSSGHIKIGRLVSGSSREP